MAGNIQSPLSQHLLLLWMLWGNVEKNRRIQLIFFIVLMIVGSFAEIISIGLVIPFLNVITNPSSIINLSLWDWLPQFFKNAFDRDPLIFSTLAFIVATIFSGFMRMLLLREQTKFSFGIGSDLSSTIFLRTLYQPYSTHLKRNSSEVLAGVVKANEIAGNTILPLLSIASSSVMILSIFTALFIINPVSTISIALALSFLYLMLALYSKKKVFILSRLISQNHTLAIKTLQEGLGGIREIIIDSTQEYFHKIYKKSDAEKRKAHVELKLIGFSPKQFIELTVISASSLLAIFYTQQGGEIILIIPTITAFVIAMQKLLPLSQQVYTSWISFRGGQSSLEDAIKLLNQVFFDDKNFQALNSINFEDEIKFVDVGFSYYGNDKLILKNINLSIKPGELVGIVGETGSGKSTLIDLMMGLLTPTLGEILIDGLPLKNPHHKSWQSQIAHVPQSIFLADVSVIQNIAFGVSAGDIDYDLVKSVADAAYISSAVENWPDSYQTLVGERGVRISGGQRQRLGIARALYKRSKILILDEATSALDEMTEGLVLDSIKRMGMMKTIIMVTHRKASLKNCSKIIELKNGSISRVCSYYEFINNEH